MNPKPFSASTFLNNCRIARIISAIYITNATYNFIAPNNDTKKCKRVTEI